MKQINLMHILLVIILGLLIYIALRPNNDSKYLDAIEKENQKISKQLSDNHKAIASLIDSIEIVNEKQTIIRNYYNEIFKDIDTFSTLGGINIRIRQQLDTLGSARFD